MLKPLAVRLLQGSTPSMAEPDDLRYRFIMTCMPTRRLLATALVGLLALPAAATPLSLEDAFTRLREGSPDLRLADNALEAANADLDIAGQRPNPVLSLSTTRINPSGGNGGPFFQRSYDSVAAWTQPIERGGKRDLRQQVAKAGIQAAGADRAGIWRDLLIATDGAWHDLAVAQETVRISDENAQLYRRTLEAAELRLKAGDIAASDVARLRVEAVRSGNDARNARAAWLQARQALARLLGSQTDPGSLEALTGWPGGDSLPQVPDFAALAEQQADVQAARYRLDRAGKVVLLAQALRSNDVALTFQVEREPMTDKPDSFGVGISVPIMIGNTYAGDIRRAQADRSAAETQLQTLRLQTQRRLESEWEVLSAAHDVLINARGQMLANAKQAADSAEYAYQRGATSLVSLLDARRSLRAASLDVLTAQANFSRHRVLWDLLTTPREI